MQQHVAAYAERLAQALTLGGMDQVPVLGQALLEARAARRAVYLCGNGGSAANALHLANDLLTATANGTGGSGIRAEALSANASVLTSLANDVGYERVYADQIRVKGMPGDLLIALSGSGNSPNIVKALEEGSARGMKTFAILGYSGGACRSIAQHPIHFDVDDMQIAEDLQLIVGHMCLQWLCANPADRS